MSESSGGQERTTKFVLPGCESQKQRPRRSGAVTGYREERTPGDGLSMGYFACLSQVRSGWVRPTPVDPVSDWRTAGAHATCSQPP
jgi:hypothetical protein